MKRSIFHFELIKYFSTALFVLAYYITLHKEAVRSLTSEGYLRIVKNSEYIVFLYWMIDIRLSSFLILLQKQILREMDPIEVTI